MMTPAERRDFKINVYANLVAVLVLAVIAAILKGASR